MRPRRFAGLHRPAGYKDRRDVQAHRGHLHTGRDLVAVRDADERIGDVGLDHVFDAVGDQVARRQRVEHAAMAHRDTIVDGDRIELDAPASGGVDDFLDSLTDVVEMHVAGDELGETIGDGDDRLREIRVGHAGGAPERACARHVSSGGCSTAAISLHGREDRDGSVN